MGSRVPRHPEAFTKRGARGQRRPRVTAATHLAWVRTLPCLVTMDSRDVEAAHIRYADARFGKRDTGLGEKPSDKFVVPLCAGTHRLDPDAQHRMGEREFWRKVGIDPVAVAAALWVNTGDTETALVILRTHREEARPC